MIKKLKELGFKCSVIESPEHVFSCLNDLKSYDVFLIKNPTELSLNILQTNSEDHFYLGFDEVLESKSVIFRNQGIGFNTVSLSARIILIFKNLSLVNYFLRNWFNNPQIDFFSRDKKIRFLYDQKRLSEIVKGGIQSQKTLRWWINRY